MKRIKILSFLLIGLCLTGCSKEKKVECAYYEQSEDFKIIYDYTINYDKSGEILKNLEMISTLEFSNKDALNEFVEQADDDICNYFSQTVNMFDNAKCKSKKEDNKISVTLTYDYAKLTDEEKENLFGNLTYNEVKKSCESSNYEQDICVFDSDKKMDPVLKGDGPLGTLNDAKKSAAEDGAYGVVKSAEAAIATYMLDNNGEMIPANDPRIGIVFVCHDGKCSYTPNGKETIYLDFKGTSPTDGEILIDNNWVVSIKKPLVINGYKCTMNNDLIECNK